jgi:UDP-2,3-diacylglucosamine pyrophosphatase LpxH
MMTPSARPTGQPSESPRYDCVVISDLHLGSDVCQAKLLEDFLEWASRHARELVINGDVFDDLNFKRLRKSHFACLKAIRRNSDRDDFRVTWVRGNHDGPAEVVGHVVGVEVHEEYVFGNDQVRLLILHGDQFDEFVASYGWSTHLVCAIFYLIQKWAPHRATRWVRQFSKRWQRNSARIQRRAVAYAAGKGFRYVTCGHTHLPLVAEDDGVCYINSGTWAEHPPCPFVTVQGAEIRLQFWPLPGAEPASIDEEALAEALSEVVI